MRNETSTKRRQSDMLALMASQTTGSPPIAFQINASDNVATLLLPAPPGLVTIRGAAGELQIIALEAIEHGHKIAVAAIAEGESIIKFGVVIGVATCSISQGEWVHLHNCGSRLDERSNAFDVHTGVPEDVRYE
jgi:altronate dehydratase small subunit